MLSHFRSGLLEFFVGLLFLFGLLVLTGIAILLIPFVMVFGILLRALLGFLFVMLGIWLLGKLTILAWRALDSRPLR